jgi:hypothetical protein
MLLASRVLRKHRVRERIHGEAAKSQTWRILKNPSVLNQAKVSRFRWPGAIAHAILSAKSSFILLLFEFEVKSYDRFSNSTKHKEDSR